MACAGPGAANLISGVLCTQDEGSPVVAITMGMPAEEVAEHVAIGRRPA